MDTAPAMRGHNWPRQIKQKIFHADTGQQDFGCKALPELLTLE
jgi:hypothetical protein